MPAPDFFFVAVVNKLLDDLPFTCPRSSLAIAFRAPRSR